MALWNSGPNMYSDTVVGTAAAATLDVTVVTVVNLKLNEKMGREKMSRLSTVYSKATAFSIVIFVVAAVVGYPDIYGMRSKSLQYMWM